MSIVEAAEEEAVARGAGRVCRIFLKIGKQSGVVPDALAAAYELAREHTTLEECSLVVEETPGNELLVSALELEG